ncbi:hypothetical protein CCACVL1_04878 [Corchorus capsularis]|uniref:LOB domain-containing protein n=1 Tax=Corchorus capsularis TaxID=210143 RepID=A0A1R3JP76_COCAP|nr:hypothetical protein CCACVL1_04878 [Corchorus capsularis]
MMMTHKSGKGTGGSSSACAACKFQRRKCIPDCPLAPYFPADQPKIFQNAHKLFGVSNILKLLKSLDPAQHAEAMRSIKYQANARDMFPVHGCVGVISQLNYQIRLLQEEFHLVNAQLEMYMYRQQYHDPNISSISMADNVHVPNSQLQLGMPLPAAVTDQANTLPLFNQLRHPNYTDSAAASLSSYSNTNTNTNTNSNNVGNNSSSTSYIHGSNINQHPFVTNNINSSCSMAIQPHHPLSLPLQQEQLVQDYDEIHHFFDSIDDRQSYIESKEAYDCSSEESIMKDTTQSMEHVAENELKSAAACFSLTSVSSIK